MEIQLKPLGNSQGIRLPKAVLQEAGFEPDDNLLIRAEAGKIVLLRSFIFLFLDIDKYIGRR